MDGSRCMTFSLCSENISTYTLLFTKLPQRPSQWPLPVLGSEYRGVSWRWWCGLCVPWDPHSSVDVLFRTGFSCCWGYLAAAQKTCSIYVQSSFDCSFTGMLHYTGHLNSGPVPSCLPACLPVRKSIQGMLEAFLIALSHSQNLLHGLVNWGQFIWNIA